MSEPNSPNHIPSVPRPAPVDSLWEHFDLYQRVYQTLFALPTFFKSPLSISGIQAADLFSFNTSLGATIESQVTDNLNEMRASWDPNQKYINYRFVRQAQTFPDVILRASMPAITPHIIMGIELKGWYVLAKEGEPSFRFRTTPAICAPWDLLVVYPWSLSNVISGSPQLFMPYATSARFAAEYRNWWWQFGMKSRGDKSLKLSLATQYYPRKTDQIIDGPVEDSNNFGRFTRTGQMDTYIDTLFQERQAGITLKDWQAFLKNSA